MESQSHFLKSLTSLNPASLKKFSSTIGVLLEQKLWARILVGMLLGLIFGLAISPTGMFAEHTAEHLQTITTFMNWLALPAKFFLKMIQMVIVPLIVASVIRGLASTTDLSQMKSLGIKFSIYVLITSVLASAIGVGLSYLLEPGKGLNLSGALSGDAGATDFTMSKINPDFLVNILPSNPLASIVEGQMLEVVVVSIILGIALISIESSKAKTVMDVLETLQSISMTVISWAMKLAPYAVFGMIAQVASTTGITALEKMGIYVLTSFLGFLSMIFIFVILASVFGKISPFVFLKKISSPMLLAFSTSSSAATMPLTMKIAEENLDVEPSVARFLIPLGTTVNMAGSAIWHTSAVVFISQGYGIDLTLGQLAFVVATSIGSAIGSPGVPGVGVGVLSAVLSKIGIPLEGISLILGVDRLVDMGCTVVNVAGDLTATTIFGRKTS